MHAHSLPPSVGRAVHSFFFSEGNEDGWLYEHWNVSFLYISDALSPSSSSSWSYWRPSFLGFQNISTLHLFFPYKFPVIAKTWTLRADFFSSFLFSFISSYYVLPSFNFPSYLRLQKTGVELRAMPFRLVSLSPPSESHVWSIINSKGSNFSNDSIEIWIYFGSNAQALNFLYCVYETPNSDRFISWQFPLYSYIDLFSLDWTFLILQPCWEAASGITS